MRASDSDIYLKWRKATQQTGLKQLILARERAKHEHLCVKGTHDSVRTRDAETCEHGCSKTTSTMTHATCKQQTNNEKET